MRQERWLDLMNRCGYEANLDTYRSLITHYSEPVRAYHNQEHITDCLEQMDTMGLPEEQARPVELALWFHDVIYNPKGQDNELKSAEIARDFLTQVGEGPEMIQCVYDLIMATLHNAQPANELEAILVDIDLSILGRDEVSYIQYCDKIREEYGWVPKFIYKKKRKEIMKAFLERDPIYSTSSFREKYEAQARSNILNEIERL